MLLTPQQIARFQLDGFLVLDRILTDEQVAKARAAEDRVYAGVFNHDLRPLDRRRPIPDWPADRTKHYVHARFLDRDFWDVATAETPARMAAELLGTASVALTEDQLLDKPPGARPLAMHQDYSYWGFADIPKMATCWIALTDSTSQMGPMQFIKGSHRWPLAPTPTNFSGGDDSQIMEAAEKVRPAGAKVDVVEVLVPAGGGSIHHAMTMHGSRGNRSPQTRHAISLHYAAAECRCVESRKTWEPWMWEGIGDGERIANRWMPVVYDNRR